MLKIIDPLTLGNDNQIISLHRNEYIIAIKICRNTKLDKEVAVSPLLI